MSGLGFGTRQAALRGTFAPPAPTFDFVIDTTNGNDANPGTPAAPWKTLSKIGGIALPAAATRSVLVKAGTYASALDYVQRDDGTPGGAPGAGGVLNIVFEPGTIMDGTAASVSAAINGFELAGSNAWTCNVTGNDLIVRNYNYSVGGLSPNGFGNRGNSIANVHGVRATGCIDGFSAHDNARLNLFDCEADDCSKAAFAHVGASVTSATGCKFTGRAAASIGIGATHATGTHIFTDCDFIPAASGQLMAIAGATVERSRIGTLTASVTLTQLETGTVNDSFVNVYADGDKRLTMRRCFGLFSTRTRAGGAIDVQKCVFTGRATGQSAIIITTSPLGAAKMVMKNNIFRTSTAAQFMNIDAAAATAMVSAGSEFNNNCLTGSAAYDADLIAADSGGTVRAGTITANPLIGAGNNMVMADYAAGAGSPCIGAATDGGNIGFATGEAVSVGVPA